LGLKFNGIKMNKNSRFRATNVPLEFLFLLFINIKIYSAVFPNISMIANVIDYADFIQRFNKQDSNIVDLY